jgi:alanine racemase
MTVPALKTKTSPPAFTSAAKISGSAEVGGGAVPAPVWIEIDLSAIRHNFQQIRRHVGPRQQILAVVKANAYGHGLLPIAQTLTASGADLLGVASVADGVALRQAGVGGRIFVMGQPLPDEASLVVAHGLTQAIGDAASAQALSRAAAAQERSIAVHLKVDTGMGRYGVWHEEAVPLYGRLFQCPGLQVEGVFTHLSSAGLNLQTTEEQIGRFRQFLQHLREKRLPAGVRHAANSVGLLRFPEARLDLVRSGLLVYGASPLKEGQPLALRPALSLKSRVRFLKRISAGRAVSYGGTWKAERSTLVATLPVGYAHGYMRALSNKAELLIRGRRAKVIGRITMEDLMADVTEVPGVSLGDEVTLIGRQGGEKVTAEELARRARTIPYEIFVALSPRIPRLYA